MLSSRYEVTKYIYGTSSIRLPECFLINSLSREAWNKDSNWLGYTAVATDEGKELLGRRDIVVAWRGTMQLYEWANDFDFPLELATSVFPSTDPNDPNDPPRIANGWLSLYTTSNTHSRFDKTSAQEQVSLKKTFSLTNFTFGLWDCCDWLVSENITSRPTGLFFFWFLGSRRAQKVTRIVQT